MKYMGSKARIAKEILPIMLKNRREDQWFIDLFAGGMNVVDKVGGKRIANDINPYLIAMWNALVNYSWKPKDYYTRDEYLKIKNNISNYEPHVVGWVGFNCSYRGKFFNGFAGLANSKDAGLRNYQREAVDNVSKQIEKLKGVAFLNDSYENIPIIDGSVVYCDIPYKDVTDYKISKFDHDKFWDWARKKSESNQLFISEYSAPDDFKCVWEKEVKSSLSANGSSGGWKVSVERLFIKK